MDSNLLISVSQVEAWKQFAYYRLKNKYGKVITFSRWCKIFYKYHVEYLNTDQNKQQVHANLVSGFVNDTALKFGGDSKNVVEIFNKAHGDIYSGYELINMDRLCDYIPTRMKNRLMEQADENSFKNLVARYHLLGTSNGLFLSIDKDVYVFLKRSSKFPLLECYASPFNHNLDEYCSVYNQDDIYGSLGRFEEYIDKLYKPVRLCLNPPYIDSIIDIAINKTLAYMKRCRGEFIAMLPYTTTPSEAMQSLFQYKNTYSILMEGETYTLHNFLLERDITAPMKLYIICNIENSLELSQQCAESIVKYLELKAVNLKGKCH